MAANATEDPNKSLASEYSRAVAAWEPAVLVEIHGHGGRKANFDIEVSAGSQLRSLASEALAGELTARMATVGELASLSVSGHYSSLYYKASCTETMQTTDWLGIHIEFPLAVRKLKGGSGGLPPAGKALAVCMAEAIDAWLPGAI